MCLLATVIVIYLQNMSFIAGMLNNISAEIIAIMLPVAVIGLVMEIYYSPPLLKDSLGGTHKRAYSDGTKINLISSYSKGNLSVLSFTVVACTS